MDYHSTQGTLRQAADLIFQVARGLSGKEPEQMDAWYKIAINDDSGIAWIRFIGDRARKYPPQSIHLVVKNHDFHNHDERFAQGNDWWGKPDNHVIARASHRHEVALAIELMCRAFWLAQQPT